jgi:uncharacterized protein (UPF0261 family)
MTRIEHLLICLSEECAEVSQRISKALRFGLQEVQPEQSLTNAERIGLELFDLIATVELLEEMGVALRPTDAHLIERKKVKLATFMKYAEECGTLAREAERE